MVFIHKAHEIVKPEIDLHFLTTSTLKSVLATSRRDSLRTSFLAATN